MTAAPWHLSLLALWLKIVMPAGELFRCHICRRCLLPSPPYPLGFPPPPGDAALGEASSTRTASQRPEVTSLSSPQAPALFSPSPWVSLLSLFVSARSQGRILVTKAEKCLPLCGASQALQLSPFFADLGQPLGSGHSPRPQLSAPVCGWRKKRDKKLGCWPVQTHQRCIPH